MSERCEWVRLLPDGAVVLRIGGREHEAELNGVALPEPPTLYRQMMEQRAPKVELRCELRPAAFGAHRPTVVVHYLASHDRSGDVWKDMSASLIELGAARVAEATFPERDEYVRKEQAARTAGAGMWKP